MLHRIIGFAVVVLGAVAVVLGVASATLWRTSPTATATLVPHGTDATLVTTAPGVLDLVSDSVRITAHGTGDEQVVLAVGRTADVDGWVGSDPSLRVDGLVDWSTLQATPRPGTAPESAPDPSTSDMWVAQTGGTGSVSLTWDAQPGQWSLLAAGVGEGATAPTLALTWDRDVTTPYLWPLVLGGLVAVAVGVALVLLGASRGRARRQASVSAVTAAARTAGVTVTGAPLTGSTATVTRRELREQAMRLAEEEAKRNRRRRGGSTPPADFVEPDPTTVAIPVDETVKGAADAWRRRWNVPARIPPRPGAAGEPDPSGTTDGAVAPTPGPAPRPATAAPTAPAAGTPPVPPAPAARSTGPVPPPPAATPPPPAAGPHPVAEPTVRLPWSPVLPPRPAGDPSGAAAGAPAEPSTDRPTDRPTPGARP